MADLNTDAIDHYLRGLMAVQATDLLLTAGSPPVLRVDGSLVRMAGESILESEAIARIIDSLLDDERRGEFHAIREIDFSFAWSDHARFRANAYHQRGSVALAVRLIPYRIPSFAELGLPAYTEKIVRLPQGFVVVTGPTGAGKSTTLASIIDAVNTQRACHIITIEDPIEYVYDHRAAVVDQREVGSDTETFAHALRSAFREDPDVLLVGEMRDNETIQAALTLAETGHLVFATLHTNDAAQTVDRIVDVFPATQQGQIRVQLAATLQAIVSQRLVRRIGGGRVGAFEVLTATFAVRNIIRDGRTSQLRNVIQTGTNDGMQTLEMALTGLVEQGIISYEDAVATSLYPQEIANPDRVAPRA